jgi:diacylglycerol kinase (ATP)
MMKYVKVLHNPDAGEGEHSRNKLITQIEEAGFDCSYSSTKELEGEKLVPKKFDFAVLAGGDGTVRRVAEELLDKKLLDKRQPIALIPCGTANNIARTLGIKGTSQEIITKWNEHVIKKFDVGRIFELKSNKFFLEGFGYGVFPQLMKEMKRRDEKSNDREEELKTALKLLHKIVLSYEAKACTITLDEDVSYSGKFLLIEVMNTRSIGPNLNIAPNADPGDGVFDVILIREDQRQLLADYVMRRLENGQDESIFIEPTKVKKVQFEWAGKLLHADDVLITLDKPESIRVELLPGVLEFLV